MLGRGGGVSSCWGMGRRGEEIFGAVLKRRRRVPDEGHVSEAVSVDMPDPDAAPIAVLGGPIEAPAGPARPKVFLRGDLKDLPPPHARTHASRCNRTRVHGGVVVAVLAAAPPPFSLSCGRALNTNNGFARARRPGPGRPVQARACTGTVG